MAFARDVYTATASQTDFTITFSYVDSGDVLVYSDGVLQSAYTLPNATTIRYDSGQAVNTVVVIQRSTSQSARLVTYTAGPLLTADLNTDSLQAFYMAQEAVDISNNSLGLAATDQWDAASLRMENLTDPTGNQDAATKKYVDDSVTSAATGTLGSPITIANGGTASATASAARTALGLAIGSDIQAYDADTAKIDAAQTWSAAQNLADQLLRRPKIIDYSESVNAIGAIGGGTQDIDLTLGNVVSGTVDTSTTTFTFSNPPATGACGSFTFIMTNGGSQTVNWPASVDWAAGTAPTLTTAGVDIFVFFTVDGGTIWYGFTSGLDMQ